MTDRDKIIGQTLKKMKSIKTLNEFKAARKDIIKLIEKIMISAIAELNVFFGNLYSMDPEQQQAESLRYQDENYLINSDVMKEADRLNSLPGGSKYAESFSLELEKIMGSYMEQYTELLGKLMEKLMDGMVGGMASALENMGGNLVDGPYHDQSEYREDPVYDPDNPDNPGN